MNRLLTSCVVVYGLMFSHVGQAFDLQDYERVHEDTLEAYNRAANELRLAEPVYRALHQVALLNDCASDLAGSGLEAVAGSLPYSPVFPEGLIGEYGLFSVTEGQCRQLFQCDETNLLCRADLRACLASAVASDRNRDTSELTAIVDSVLDYYEVTGLQADAAYARDNGQSAFWSDKGDITVDDALTAFLVEEGWHPFTNTDIIYYNLTTGSKGNECLNPDASALDRCSQRLQLCSSYRQGRDAYVRASYELSLAYASMVSAKAGLVAVTETYFENVSCGIGLPATEWINE
jgi:hypothetical protein